MTSEKQADIIIMSSAETSGAISRPADEDDDFLFTAFKKLKVDPQWSEDSLVNDVSTEALRDLWAGKTAPKNHRSRAKPRGLKSRKKHRHSSKPPYTVENLPCMDALTLSQEKCSCDSCNQCHSDDLFGLCSAADLGNKSILREARLKLHHSEKDRKSVIWKAKLKLKSFREESKSPSGANTNTTIPDAIFGAKSKSDSFSDVKGTRAKVTPGFESGPVFSEERNEDRLGEVRNHQKRREPTIHRTCSQEAKLDEMTVDELAGYFDDCVYLPRKMSEMAEMMYT